MLTALEILNLAEKMKRIPHLKLDLAIDSAGLLQELETVKDKLIHWRPDPERPIPPSILKEYEKNWSLLSVIDYFKSQEASSKEFRATWINEKVSKWENGLDATQTTDLGLSMPRTVAQVFKMGDFPGRCRISCISGFGNLDYHSHYIKSFDTEWSQQFKGSLTHFNTPEYVHLIVHIPIITNPSVVFSVKSLEDSKLTWRQHYEVGSAYIFNSWMEHNVYNKQAEPRYHLMCHMHLVDEKFFDLVTRSLAMQEKK